MLNKDPEIITDNEKGIFENIEVSDTEVIEEPVVEEDKPKNHYDTSIKPEYHPIANGEPMMTQTELDALVEDMNIRGFKDTEPITMYQGLILDGRNRSVAAKYAEVDVVTREFIGTYQEAESESISLNNHRRHKSAGQKAMAAAYALKANKARRDELEKDILSKNPTIGKRRLSNQINHKCLKLSSKAAAKQQDCGTTNVTNATKLLEEEPDLAQSVFEGKLSLTKGLSTLQEINELRNVETKLTDGERTPEELERHKNIEQVKRDPEGAVAKLEVKDNQIEELRDEVKKLLISNKGLFSHSENIESELSDFKEMYVEHRLSINVD